MGRKSRILIPGAYYHVFTRGQRKNPICFNKEDFRRIERQIFEAFSKFDTELNAYCVMRNHFHLLIRLKRDELWRPIHRIKTLYAMYFNEKYDLSGHVFQGRYKSYVILNEKYLSRVMNYIHNNPVKENLVKNPSKYPYSSAAVYGGNRKGNVIRIPRLRMSSNDDYPLYKGVVGSLQDFEELEKRTDKRYIRVIKEKRIKEKISEQIKSFLAAKNIKISVFSKKKWRLKNKEIMLHLINYLLDRGYTQADIAKYLGYSETYISLKLSKKK